MRRRDFLQTSLATSLLGALPDAWAQAAYPNKSITTVVPFAAGGGGDLVARVMAKGLSERVGQPVVVENRVGAGGNIGAASVMRSRPDGYTLLNLSSTYAIQAVVSKPGFDALADMQPIVMLTRDPQVLIVHANAPWRDLRELTQAAKAKPGSLSYGTAGVGTIAHLTSEDLAFNLGVQLMHIPYKGSSAAYADVLSNTLSMMMTTSTFAVPQVRSGKVRALAVVGASRLPSMPNVPTFGELGLTEFSVYDWKAVAGPRGMPPDLVAFLNREFNEVLKTPAAIERLQGDGAQIVGGTPEQLMQVIHADIERWKSLIVRAKLKIE